MTNNKEVVLADGTVLDFKQAFLELLDNVGLEYLRGIQNLYAELKRLGYCDGKSALDYDIRKFISKTEKSLKDLNSTKEATNYISTCCAFHVHKDQSNEGTFTYVCDCCGKDCDVRAVPSTLSAPNSEKMITEISEKISNLYKIPEKDLQDLETSIKEIFITKEKEKVETLKKCIQLNQEWRTISDGQELIIPLAPLKFAIDQIFGKNTNSAPNDIEKHKAIGAYEQASNKEFNKKEHLDIKELMDKDYEVKK